MKDTGYGKGYRYAHDEVGGVAELQCLPDELVGAVFYRPTDRGWEARIRERLGEIAKAQGKSVAGLVREIDERRAAENVARSLSASIRLYVLAHGNRTPT